MEATLATLVRQASAWSLPEEIAVATAIGYLLLAIRQNIWCWLCAAISTAIYIYLFLHAKLYMESLLNAYYLGMAAYGWYVWSSGHNRDVVRPVVVMPLSQHILAILVILLLSAISGTLLARYTDAKYPFIDSWTTWSAFWATFLVARKVLENWWYWLAIDAVCMVIYWTRDLQLTSALFLLYLLMIPFGLLSWRRSLGAQPG